MSTTSTALVPAIERGKIALKKGDSLKAVAEAMVDEVEVSLDAPVEFPPPAPVVTITDEVAHALIALPGVFGKVQPTERCVLSDEEIKALYEEQVTIKTVMAALQGREEAIKTTIRHHLDVDAEQRGVAVPKAVVRGGHVVVEASPRDAAGHYVLGTKGNPERVNIPGTNQAYSREMREGSLTVDGNRLKEMHEAGEVSREDYLAMTREVRVFDEAKALEAVKKDPARLSIIKRISYRTGIGSALFIRKAN